MCRVGFITLQNESCCFRRRHFANFLDSVAIISPVTVAVCIDIATLNQGRQAIDRKHSVTNKDRDSLVKAQRVSAKILGNTNIAMMPFDSPPKHSVLTNQAEPAE